ncbi:UNVERIFIED_CONTAM: hypothetical protein PYX00_008000 [Menopon gallinae]|uniref:Arrestin-like N-terminal domain-containing protein n=1 Tax=Menopon gallinae TaxID=328185 RepID=A0AAW2HLK8_9NEOP
MRVKSKDLTYRFLTVPRTNYALLLEKSRGKGRALDYRKSNRRFRSFFQAATSSLKRTKLPPQLIRFQVQLDEPNKIYFAGDEIKGHVQVDLSESLPIQGIILRIVGEAYVNVSDEPRPWTARKIGKIKSTFRNRKMYGTQISQSRIRGHPPPSTIKSRII